MLFIKNMLLVLCTVLIWKANAQTNSNQDKDWAYLNRYAQANKSIGKKGCKVIFLGNSITENWYKFDSAFFLKNNFTNRGISGQTTSQFLVRFRSDVIDNHPKILVLNGGINDIAENTGDYNEDYTFNNIVSMVELAQFHNIKVVLSSILPTGGFNWNMKIKSVPMKIASLNYRISNFAKKNHLAYVDYYGLMIDDNKTDMQKKYSIDGVHPNLEGYHVMEKLILNIL